MMKNSKVNAQAKAALSPQNYALLQLYIKYQNAVDEEQKLERRLHEHVGNCADIPETEANIKKMQDLAYKLEEATQRREALKAHLGTYPSDAGDN